MRRDPGVIDQSPVPLDAGDLAAWVQQMRAALRGEQPADVPCGTCTACCRSSQFVHVGPDEADALAHLPAELLFPAPGLPDGHMVMGYDERGACPMLAESGCTIYEHRPRTCRTYDCRIFPAMGIDPAAEVPLVAEQARRWRFSETGEDDRALQAALTAAAEHVRAHPDRFPQATDATKRAVAAFEHHQAEGSG